MVTLFIIILLSIAFWNAYVILWKTGIKQKQKLYSKIWHGIGLFLRVSIWAGVPTILLTSGNWSWNKITLYTALFIVVGGVLYDFIINVVRYFHEGVPPIFYVDNKGWNAVFLKRMTPKQYWIFRILVGVGLIILTVLI